jgi:hypothetical protein
MIPFRRKFLYTKSFWLTHSCAPNAETWIDSADNQYRLVIKAIQPIKIGEKISIDYGERYSYLPTLERRTKLQELYGINCRCKRCRDPSELGSYISAVRCDENMKANHCFGYYVATDPLNEAAAWKCADSKCSSTKSYGDIQALVSSALKELPSVGGQAELAMAKLIAFVEFYSGDIFHPSHYVIRIARLRMRQIVKFFLETNEKMFLCLINDYPSNV